MRNSNFIVPPKFLPHDFSPLAKKTLDSTKSKELFLSAKLTSIKNKNNSKYRTCDSEEIFKEYYLELIMYHFFLLLWFKVSVVQLGDSKKFRKTFFSN